MQLIFPKRSPVSLIKRTEKALKMLDSGAARYRKSNRFGYRTLDIGHCERLVALGDVIHVFNRHSEYEKFINNPAYQSTSKQAA